MYRAMLGKKLGDDGRPSGEVTQMFRPTGTGVGNLESKLSPDERRRSNISRWCSRSSARTAQQSGLSKLFEAISQKFAPLFKAAGSTPA